MLSTVVLDDSVLTPDSSDNLVLTGKVPPLTNVRILAQSRKLEESMAGSDGRFYARINVPAFVPWMRMQLFDAENIKQEEVNLKINWDLKTHNAKIITARYLRGEGKLWVNGCAPQDSFSLLALSADSEKSVYQELPGEINRAFPSTLENVRTYWDTVSIGSDYVSPANGIFDLVIPFHEGWAKRIAIRSNRDGAGIPILETSRDSLGLHRKVEILIGTFNDPLVGTEDFRQLKKKLGDQGDSISAFAPGFTIKTGARPNPVDIQGSTWIFLEDNLRLDGQRKGVAGLFAVDRDTLQITLNGQKLAWVEKPFPKVWTDSLAVWVESPDSGLPSLFIGVSGAIKANTNTLSRRNTAAQAHDSQKDFFNRFETRIGGSPGNGIWTKVLGLVPFLWAAWIIRRFPKGTRKVAAPLMVLTGLFALLSVIDITSEILTWIFNDLDRAISGWGGSVSRQHGLEDAFSRIINPVAPNGLVGALSYLKIFADSFWMVFTGIIIFSPVYFKELVMWAEMSERREDSRTNGKCLLAFLKRCVKLSGWALFVALGLGLFLAHWYYCGKITLPAAYPTWVYRLIAQTPLLTAWAVQVPVIRYLIEEILPGNFLQKLRGWMGACLALAIPLLSVDLPVDFLLALVTAALFTGLGWTVFYGFDLPALDGWLGRKKACRRSNPSSPKSDSNRCKTP